MIKLLLFSILFLFCFGVLEAQLYSPTKRVSVDRQDGPGVLGFHAVSVSDNNNAFDGNPQTYSTLVSAVSILGIGSPFQELGFASKVPAGTTIHVKVGTAGGLLGVGSGVNVDTYNNSTGLFINKVDSKVVGGSGTLINLLSGGNIVDYTFKTTGEMQYIRISFPSILGVANGFVRLYDVYYETPSSSSIACNNISDYLYGVDANALLDAASLTNGVTNPQNAFDNNENTSASLVAVAAVLNYSQLTAMWPGLSRPGDSVQVIFDQGGTALALDLLTNLSILTFRNDTLVDNLNNKSSLLNLRLIAGSNNKYILSFAPTQSFNRLSFRNGAIVSVNLGVNYNVYEIKKVAQNITVQGLSDDKTTLYSGNQINLPTITTVNDFNTANWYYGDSTLIQNTSLLLDSTTQFYAVGSRAGCYDINTINTIYTAHVATAIPSNDSVAILPNQTNRPKLSMKLGGDYTHLVENSSPKFRFSNVQGLQSAAISGLSITPQGEIIGDPLISGTIPITTEVYDSSNNLRVGISKFALIIPYSLPVKYSSELLVINQFKENILSWTTTQEINNKGFYIQKSKNGTDWSNLNFIPSKNINGSGLGATYNYSDDNLSIGTNFYRLEQMDLDGKKSFSKIVSIYNAIATTKEIVAYPNPVTNILTLLNVQNDQSYKIIDLSGKILSSGKITTLPQSIDVSNAKSGVLIVNIMNSEGSRIKTIKITKK